MIVVTGGAGFIGSNLVAALNESGMTDVVIIDSLGDGSKWKNVAKRRFEDFILPSEIDKFLSGSKRADAVFHLGANSSTTAIDGDEIIRSNFRLSVDIWKWCTRRRTPLIYASSAATYGDGAQGFIDDESQSAMDNLRPLNLYGWSKLAFDRWALERAQERIAPPHWTGLKFFNVYGPNESHKGDMQSLVAKNTHKIVQGERVPLFKSHRPDYADGQQLRDFVYVKDCTAVMMWLMEHPRVNGIFNLGTGVARSFYDLVSAIGLAFRTDVEVDFIEMPISIRDKYQYFTQADMNKLRQAGFNRPFHSLEEGVADYVLGYLTQSDIYR